jgi:23S rRNA (guanosine2251-2'-O)-methyltransferase
MSTNNIIFGSHPVIEALRSGKDIEKLLLKKDLSGEVLREVLKYSRELDIPYQFVPNEKLDRITRKNHQGIIAFVSEIEYQKLEQIIPMIYEDGKEPFILILDHITDVRNFGSIARTAECAGIHAIVIPDKGSAHINADAVKTSSGALNVVPVCRVNSISKAIDYLKDSGLKIIAASEKGKELFYKADLSGPVAIISGSEDVGVSAEIMNKADKIVKIPMFGKIESLNVSVATALIVYEAIRSRLG